MIIGMAPMALGSAKAANRTRHWDALSSWPRILQPSQR